MAEPSFQPSTFSRFGQGLVPASALQPGAGRSGLTLPVDTEPKKPKAALMVGGIALAALVPFVVGPWAVKQFKPEWSYGKRLVTSFIVSVGLGAVRRATREPSPDQPPLRELWSGSLTEEGVELGNPGFLPEVPAWQKWGALLGFALVFGVVWKRAPQPKNAPVYRLKKRK